jgi:O-acetyl-ADP-ribose deacetylase (regulator of RNase III)
MPFTVASRRASTESLQRRFRTAMEIDVTSRAPEPWVRFSPFFPHGGIPVPFSTGVTAASVEGLWQGLKVFEHASVDLSKLNVMSMRGLKRSARRFGAVLGHRAGVHGSELLSYAEARRRIYLPAYHWVLDHCLQSEIDELRHLGEGELVVLLDYETNADLDDLSRPLSHASLLVRYLDGTLPADGMQSSEAANSIASTGKVPQRLPLDNGEAMSIRYVAGDLFANRFGAQAFAHGCNCQGSMGAGIAKTFRARYPAMYEAYRARCRVEPRQFNLGDAWLWQEEGQPTVFNLGTQEHYWRARASYEAIGTALTGMRQQADARGITTIAIPRIGVGYGGLSWPKVRALIEEAFGDWRGTLYVYETFEPEEGTSASSGMRVDGVES